MTRKRTIVLWAPVILFIAAIFLVSGTSDPGVRVGRWDKLLHAATYMVLGLLTLRACHGGFVSLRSGATMSAMAVAIGYGLLDEFHQSRVPGRYASVGDWLADALGALLAVPVAIVFANLKKRFRRSGARRTPREPNHPSPGVEP